MFKVIISVIISLAFIFAAIKLDAGIIDTKHNLSSTGPGTIKATSETQICVFCHTPHAATQLEAGWKGILWNHQLSSASYTISDPAYSREFGTGLQLSTPIQPDRGSKLCLSCHDGTVALGALYNAPGPGGLDTTIGMTVTTMPATSAGYVGTNLRNTHLVSIAYTDGLVTDKNDQYNLGISSFQWKAFADGSWATSKIKLKSTAAQYKGAQNSNGTGVQCSTCHNPHLGTTYRKFLVADYDNTSDTPNTEWLCTFCHY